MNGPKLLTLVSLVGMLATGGTAIYVANNTTTKADLLDAGIAACPAIDAICPARRPKAGGGFEYARIRTVARDCRTEGYGFVLRPAPGGAEWLRVDLCQKAAAQTLAQETDTADEPFDCACSSGANCKVPNPDGGANLNAPLGETLGPGYRFAQFGGAGCVAKSCGGIFNGSGDETWPVGCP